MRHSKFVPSLLLFMLSITLFCAGCSQSNKKDIPPKNNQRQSDTGNNSQQTSKIISPVGDGADAAVQRVINGLQSNNPFVLWQALPASYQNDINELVHLYAQQMDEELWSEIFTTLKKATRILKKQKRFYLEQQIARNGPREKERIEKRFNQVLQILSILIESDIGDIKALRTIDVGDIVKTVGGDSMQQFEILSEMAGTATGKPLSKIQIGQMRVKLLSSKGENGIVLISSPDKTTGTLKQEEVQFVKVEEKWIPKELATNWKSDIASARKKLKQMTPEFIASIKPRLMNVLKQVNGGLDEMDTAQNAREFSMAKTKATAPLYGLAFNLAISPPDLQPEMKAKPVGKGIAVTIVIQGESNENAIGKLEEQLLLMDSDVEQMTSNVRLNAKKNNASLKISPVYDISKFAKSLPFGKVTKIDKEKQIIYVTVSKK
ncbi:hypothetical protein MNBD_PLANCTO02-65 [hydrothermal vent metagenome]|uniref:Uncharacterized protein n=1 Tax=hydrothermal vent metagenome TaxID=652676 RepID=A0A3B1DIN6_9ZZZZ